MGFGAGARNMSQQPGRTGPNKPTGGVGKPVRVAWGGNIFLARGLSRRLAQLIQLGCICLGLVLGFFYADAYADPGQHAQGGPKKPKHRQDRILILPRAGADLTELAQLHRRNQARAARQFEAMRHLQVVHLPPGRNAAEMIREYEASGLVEFAEPDYELEAAIVPSDPFFGALWGLSNQSMPGADINAPAAWDTLTDAGNVIVAVVDSGIRYTHEDLAPNIWVNPRDGSPGFNAITGSSDPWDDNGHGTLVAGVIGAVSNNGRGVVGVAWRVQLMACKFLDATGNGYISDAIECIEFARTNGAHVINASWGGYVRSAALAEAIAAAGRAGIIFVAAAGNNGANNDQMPFYPASYLLDNVISVAASTPNDTLAGFSNYGAQSVHLAAPGTQIYSTHHAGNAAYAYASGTSLAAPHVSGAVALLRARYPTEPYQKLIRRLLAGVDRPAGLSDKCVSGGRLNLATALNPIVLADFTMTLTNGQAPLMVQFVDASEGRIVKRVWDFGDGVRVTNVLSPAHVFTNQGDFTVMLEVTGDRGAQSRAMQKVRVNGSYCIHSAGFSWVDPDVMYPLPLNANGVTPLINLPFPFYFYGSKYQQICAAANGMISFGAQLAGAEAATNAALPVMYPLKLDPQVAAGVNVWYGVRGKPPLRRVVIAWSPITVTTPTGPGTISVEAVLFESSQRFLFQYLIEPAALVEALPIQNATVGAMNAGGAGQVLYSVNSVPVLTNQQALLFVPQTGLGVTNYPTATLEPVLGEAPGQFKLKLAGQPAGTYAIEATANFTDWVALGTNAADLDGNLVFSDPVAQHLPARFYRARFVP